MIRIFSYESSFSSSYEMVSMEVEKLFEEFINCGLRMNDRLRVFLNFALRELFNNSVEHGNKMDLCKEVRYVLKITREAFEIEVFDCGQGFDIASVIRKERQDSISRHRSRGLTVLEDMGFSLAVSRGSVCARLAMGGDYIIDDIKENKMNISIENETAILVLNTTLVAANVRELVEMARAGLEKDEEYKYVIIDLTSSESIDSMGITFLIGLYKTATNRGKILKLKGVSDTMMSLFKVMKLDEVFEFVK